MSSKSEQIQIRVTPREKARLKRSAAAAGQDVSNYVLSRALPSSQRRFEELLELLADGMERRYVLAELNDLLSPLAADELARAVVHADLSRLSPLWKNYVAAMVEQACHSKRIQQPAWTADVAPLEDPHFTVPLRGLRLHLVSASPVPFKRRNIFVDTGVGGRV